MNYDDLVNEFELDNFEENMQQISTMTLSQFKHFFHATPSSNFKTILLSGLDQEQYKGGKTPELGDGIYLFPYEPSIPEAKVACKEVKDCVVVFKIDISQLDQNAFFTDSSFMDFKGDFQAYFNSHGTIFYKGKIPFEAIDFIYCFECKEGVLANKNYSKEKCVEIQVL